MIFTKPGFSSIINDLTFLLNNHYSKSLGIFFIILLVMLSVIGLLKRSNYITNLMLWLLILNINNFLYSTTTAGDYLLNQLLFFNIFFSLKIFPNVYFNDVKTALHNMALAGIKIQICMAYLLASWFKLTDVSWLQGIAVYQIFQIPEYTNALLLSLPLWFCVVLNYLTIIYQLLFPVIIWLRPFKIYVLVFGIIQHLIIAFAMGLFSFGLIMTMCYILFLKYDYGSLAYTKRANKSL